MPAILIDRKEQAEWLNDGEESLRLQRPLGRDDLEIHEQASD
jgi:putative SOS response-associated peptidase YedK